MKGFVGKTVWGWASVAVMLAVVGCAPSAPTSSAAQIQKDNPEQTALSDKLKDMSPDERAAYVQAHQDEVQKTYSGLQTPGVQGQAR